MGVRRRRLVVARELCLALAVGWLLHAAAVEAQVPSINFRRPFVPMHPEGTLAAEPAESLPPWRPHLGLWGSYAQDVVEVRTLDDDPVGTPLQSQWVADAFMNWGVGSWLTVGALLPVAMHQAGESVPVAGVPEPPSQALGDLSLRAKVSILTPSAAGERADGFGLAWMASVSLPTGDRASYLGDGQVNVESHANGEYSVGIASLRATAGGYWRPTTRTYVGEDFGSALTWGASAGVQAFEATNGTQSLIASVDARGEVGLADPIASRAASPALLGGVARFRSGAWSFLGGAELPLVSAVGCPSLRVVLGAEWAPRELDLDGDGVSGSADRCPAEAEDIDYVSDADGCPDLDVDRDGVADEHDQCLPHDAGTAASSAVEDRDGFQDDDGCLDADNDGDGVADALDACPGEKGDPTSSRAGCMRVDADKDGVDDVGDKCPGQPEDMDGHEDADGCADPDNDADGVIDGDDACPATPGTLSFPLSERGCPDRDADQDTFPGDADRCGDLPEDFNGRDDEDGCPDAVPGDGPANALVKVVQDRALNVVVFQLPPSAVIGEDGNVHVARESVPSLRALARLLIQDRGLQVAVSVGPSAANPEQAQIQAQRMVQRLNELAHDGGAAVSDEFPQLLAQSKLKSAALVVILRRRDVSSN